MARLRQFAQNDGKVTGSIEKNRKNRRAFELSANTKEVENNKTCGVIWDSSNNQGTIIHDEIQTRKKSTYIKFSFDRFT